MLSRPLVGELHAVDEWIDIGSMVTYYQICERYIVEKLADFGLRAEGETA